jgi:tetratricopeptide (TPR) repeat protein
MFERAYRIGTIAGIEVRVHWTIVLAPLYFYWTIRPETATATVVMIVMIALLFASVTLHELGHALVARHFGIPTRRIVLLPLGGVALLDHQPSRPSHDVQIAAAGPLVNFTIVGLVGLASWGLQRAFGPDWAFLLWERLNEPEWVRYLPAMGSGLFQINLTLALLNLLPIYPLDGGRILRAGIQAGFGAQRANRFMLLVGIPLAAGLLIYAVTQQTWLEALIAALLILAVASLHPRFARQINLGFAAITDRAHYHFQRGDYVRAVEAYTGVLSRQQANVNAYHNRGAAYHNLGDHERAKADYDRAIELDPQRVKLYIDRAELHQQRKDDEQALADFDRAIALQPHNPELYTLRAGIYFARHDYTQAIQCYDRALELAPDRVQLRGARAFARYMDGEEIAPIIAELDDLVRRNPGDAMLRVHRGAVYLYIGRYAEARHDFDGAHQSAPDDVYGLYYRALLRYIERDAAGALADYEHALTHAPTWSASYAGAAMALQWLGEHERARAAIDRALALDPDEEAYYSYRAAIHYAQGQHDQARADLAHAIALDAEDSLVHDEVWLAAYLADNLDWVLAYYDWAEACLPDSALVWQGRADALRVNGQHDEALAAYERALALQPERAVAYAGRGLLNLARGARDQAQADFAQALEHDPPAQVRRAVCNALYGAH